MTIYPIIQKYTAASIGTEVCNRTTAGLGYL